MTTGLNIKRLKFQLNEILQYRDSTKFLPCEKGYNPFSSAGRFLHFKETYFLEKCLFMSSVILLSTSVCISELEFSILNIILSKLIKSAIRFSSYMY